MIKNKLCLKNRAKFYKNIESLNTLIPARWCDFAKLCKIRSGEGIVYFDPYPYQVKLIDCIEKHQTTVICKTRQLGVTETILNYFLWKACLNPAYLAVVFSKNQSDTSGLAKRLRRSIESIQDYVTLKTDNLTDLELSTGGRILFRNGSINGSRGLESVCAIFYDEAAFVPEIEELFRASVPTTSMLGNKARLIINSTPSGQSGWYWQKLNSNNPCARDILKTAEDIRSENIEGYQSWTDLNGWGKVLIHWLAHPLYSLKKKTYLDDIKKQFELSEMALQQEFNLSFLHSESIIFSSALIRESATGEIEKIPDYGCFYYAGLDTSTIGKDYCVFTILKLDDFGVLHLVNYYRKREVSSEYHLFKISELIDLYRPEKVAIEWTGGVGVVYQESLSKTHPDRYFLPIKTTQESKARMINRLLLAFETKKLTIPNDRVVLDELLNFRKNDNGYSAPNNKNDDIVMSLCFALEGAKL